jgi:CheY-like chemotaxis protein
MSTSETAALRVYLVEDDPDHALLIRRALRQADQPAEVTVFTDGEAALAALRGESASGPGSNGEAALAGLRRAADTPDLILLDINMPGLSGLELLAQVKADAALRRIPVVMLTSSELPADVARAYALGASGYISKPSYQHDLRAVLGNTLLYWAAMKRPPVAEGSLA